MSSRTEQLGPQTASTVTSTLAVALPEPMWKRLLFRQETALIVVYALMLAVFISMNPRFASPQAFANIMQDFAPVLLMAIGQTFVIITGGIDLSVGSVLGFSGVMTALVAKVGNEAGWSGVAAIAAAIVVGCLSGLAVGIVNGLLVTRARLNPFIATLATMGAVYGATLVVTKGIQISGGPKEVILLGNTAYLGMLTVPVIAVLVIAVISWLALAQTRFGRYTYALGSNSFAARAKGVNVERHLMKVYAICGLLAALAGVFTYLRLGSGSPASGRGAELQAIAAAVVGGISFSGGFGRMGGTILGSLILTTVLSGLIMIGVAPDWQQIVTGVLIAGAVIVQRTLHLRGGGQE